MEKLESVKITNPFIIETDEKCKKHDVVLYKSARTGNMLKCGECGIDDAESSLNTHIASRIAVYDEAVERMKQDIIDKRERRDARYRK